MLNKKSILLLLLVASNGLFSAKQPIENDYSSGTQNLIDIMSNGETGISAFNKKNLKFVSSQNLDKDLNLEKIVDFFGCKTLIGKTFMLESVKNPLNSENHNATVINRQAFIKTLVDNPVLKQSIEQLLETAKNHEQEVIKLFSDFFKGKTCPELSQLEEIKKINPFMYPMVKYLTLNPTGKYYSFIMTSIGAVGCSFTAAKYLPLSAQIFAQDSNFLLLVLYITLLAGLNDYAAITDYKNALEKRFKIHSLNRMIYIAEELENICNHNSLYTNFKISHITDDNAKSLISSLKHSRYSYHNTLAFQTPLVHTFLYKIYENKRSLSEMFASIAEIDAYNAIANKILESQNSSTPFCFVNFIENERPKIEAETFWNVLVEKPIASNLTESKNIILTGPNAGGKTTSIRSILQNIVLGQTFGIAAASKFDFTMFDIIHSYLNISDDLIAGLSLFKSELKRAQDILQEMKALPTNKKFFFALDELFTGTVSEDGETCAYEFVKKISNYVNTQFIYATHFNKLKELGENNDLCMNYKVDAPVKNNDGKLVYPYTLSQGANQVGVAIDLAKESGLFD